MLNILISITSARNFQFIAKKPLKPYNAIWDKINNFLEKGFHSELVYDNKHIRTKTNLYSGKINANFEGNKIPQEGVGCICFSIILLDSFVRVGKRYYQQRVSEKLKYTVKNAINEEFNLDEFDDKSDEENYVSGQ